VNSEIPSWNLKARRGHIAESVLVLSLRMHASSKTSAIASPVPLAQQYLAAPRRSFPPAEQSCAFDP